MIDIGHTGKVGIRPVTTKVKMVDISSICTREKMVDIRPV